ncbi:hypothetical protein ABB37_09356 [Leptomonas pyrrhocoris]|uniref:Uncharacterized protein n=1 Tax=Leptomonas pyrrhocoris TaxID=157538 RepID=A0A0M9FQP7_LEPPY|nr:hypothetical protein ABB37_09356 [Leptomonas pyrrhocoris]XP_015652487.1 hypothetical protein ABB37_09356 [Leptomonas pyrrhocoris]KPA74047.1 hypothetical protein ABB37_09356 [Leptomonas pyrrhocoris]KPA74048.1 hypothetical protein ABB37_09356 [Leptomonas pyrrhocoris]|eukprot:XP_015652486.1 hypothetical protein ABB37_09356 [Leptomonas pyrrhocoris]
MSGENGTADTEAQLLEQLSEKYYEAIKRDSRGTAGATVEVSLMRMMAAMGELSALAFANASGISPFEREEVSRLIGKLSISVASIAEAFGLNVARSTLQYLDEEMSATPAVPPRNASGGQSSSPPNNDTPLSSAANAPSPQNPNNASTESSAQSGASVVLSPASNVRFFHFVDQLATAPRESFEEANLRWVAPAPNGAIEELIPNGRAITVEYDDFPRYRAQLAQYRETRAWQARASSASASPNPVNLSANTAVVGGGGPSPFSVPTGPAVASIPAALPAAVAQASGYDPARESDLYSPSHFSGGFFSPMARVAETGVVNVYPPAAVMASEAANGADADVRRRQALRQIGRPYEVRDFNQKVRLLRSGVVQGTEIAKLGLTFSVPDGPQVIELIGDGMQVDVTAANAKAFLTLLDDFSSAQAPSPAQVHRTNSVRKINVGSIIPDVTPTFSPSHFSHDLFAPYSKPTSAVYVDYDKSERILPPFLKEQSPPAEPKDTRNVYLSAARCSDCATLERILREVKANPAAVSKYGVTFCVPSSLEPYSSAEELHTGLHALFPSSALQPVTPEQQPQFLSLVRQYFPHVL